MSWVHLGIGFEIEIKLPGIYEECSPDYYLSKWKKWSRIRQREKLSSHASSTKASIIPWRDVKLQRPLSLCVWRFTTVTKMQLDEITWAPTASVLGPSAGGIRWNMFVISQAKIHLQLKFVFTHNMNILTKRKKNHLKCSDLSICLIDDYTSSPTPFFLNSFSVFLPLVTIFSSVPITFPKLEN